MINNQTVPTPPGGATRRWMGSSSSASMSALERGHGSFEVMVNPGEAKANGAGVG
jgi:hypothetical protein